MPPKRIWSYFAAGMIWRPESNFGSEFLVQRSKSLRQKTGNNSVVVKFPGGMNLSAFGEFDPKKTVQRELLEETFLLWNLHAGLEVKPFVSKDGHQKFFFPIPWNDVDGEMRTTEIVDGDTLIYPPEWMSAEKVWELIYHTHRPALEYMLELPSPR